MGAVMYVAAHLLRILGPFCSPVRKQETAGQILRGTRRSSGPLFIERHHDDVKFGQVCWQCLLNDLAETHGAELAAQDLKAAVQYQAGPDFQLIAKTTIVKDITETLQLPFVA